MERTRRRRDMKSFVCILLLLINYQLIAQEYEVEVQLKKVDRTGFYRIFLEPLITGKTKNNLQDIRLSDNKENEIPYYLYHQNLKQQKDHFESFYVKEVNDSSILLENQQANSFDKFVMKVKKNKFTKRFNIQGSNDLRDWKTFKKDVQLPIDSLQDSTQIQEHEIALENNNYKYFRITYLDSLRQNFDGFHFGRRKKTILETTYTEIKSPLFEQHFDENTHETVFLLSFYQHHFVDRLQFTFNKHHSKETNKAQLFQVYEENGQQKERLLKEFKITDKEINVIEFDHLFTKKMILRVEHPQKEPLILKKIEAHELKKYLIAYLYRHKEYFLKLGNDTISHSLYDDKKLKQQNPSILSEVSLKELKTPIKKWKKRKIKVLESQYSFWIGIFLFFGLLAMFFIRLIREKQKKKEDEKVS